MRLYRKEYYLIGCICIFSFLVTGQNQKLADSLINQYQSANYQGDESILLLKIAENEQNPERKLLYAELLIKKAASDSIFKFLHSGYLQKGNSLVLQGNYAPALDAYFESLSFANQIENDVGIGVLHASIANTYSMMGNSRNAMEYYHKAIEIARKNNDSISLGSILINVGDEHLLAKVYDSALVYFEESGQIFRKVNYLKGTAYNLGNMGMVHAELGQDNLAEININEAINLLEELEDYYPISVYLTYLSDIYLKRGNISVALRYAERSLQLATTYGLKDQMSSANLKLSRLYEEIGNTEASYKFYKDHIAYRDSIKNIESIQQMANMETTYQVAQKEAEIAIVNQQKKTQRIIAIVMVLLFGSFAFGLYRRNKFIQKTKRIIEKEKDRSEALLLNILPEEIAEELKATGKADARDFDKVSILFTDFKEFTQTAETLSAQELVEEINVCFEAFDHICEKFNIEKIKTIGDSYMAAGGLPVPSEDAVKNTLLAAFEMQQFIIDRKACLNAAGKPAFEMRLGIHTGPIVAGIVGVKKFQYDIWGDTVNTASRMESNGQVGKVNISQYTYDFLKDDPLFNFEKREKIQVKGKGALVMYFVRLQNAA